MRVTLDYDEAFWAEVLLATGARTKSEAVHIALRRSIAAKQRENEWNARWQASISVKNTTDANASIVV